MIRIPIWLVLLSLLIGFPAGAKDANQLSQLANEAAQRAASSTSEPNEIEMIEYRRHLMGQPGLQLYVVFFNEMGQTVDYFVTSGKCTSSRKRLTQPWRFIRGIISLSESDKGTNYNHGDFVADAADIDGTFGPSDHYVYCRTVDGKYKQWNGQYYISDSPIELTVKPVIVTK